MKKIEKTKDLDKLIIDPIEKNQLEQLRGGFAVYGADNALAEQGTVTNTNSVSVSGNCSCSCTCTCSAEAQV